MSSIIEKKPFTARSGRRFSSRFRVEHRTEVGAVIILALVYIVSISLVVGALADWAMNDLNTTTKFQSVSSLDYAVSIAVQVAVQSIRYAPLMSQTASPAIGECRVPAIGSATQLTVNNLKVTVWCKTTQNLASVATRVVTFYACTGPAASTGLACAGSKADLLTAVVTFDDYPGWRTAALDDLQRRPVRAKYYHRSVDVDVPSLLRIATNL